MQEMEVDSWAGTARSITVHAAQTVVILPMLRIPNQRIFTIHYDIAEFSVQKIPCRV